MFSDTASALKDIAVNTNHRISTGNSSSNSASYWAMVVRKLNSKGRNISISSNGNWGNSKSKSFSRSDIKYFQESAASRNTFTNQYSNNPSENWWLSGRISYSEPIVKNLFAQASYEYGYSYSNSDRSLYQLDSLPAWRDMYSPVIGTLPTDADSLRMTLNMRNSQYATYKNYTHKMSVGVRYNSKNLQFHAAVNFEPRKTKLEYQKGPSRHSGNPQRVQRISECAFALQNFKHIGNEHKISRFVITTFHDRPSGCNRRFKPAVYI